LRVHAAVAPKGKASGLVTARNLRNAHRPEKSCRREEAIAVRDMSETLQPVLSH
jgi:hypothetical protein